MLPGAIFDIRGLYDDVFYVVGALYVLDGIIFAAIPGLEWWRNYTGQTTYDDIAGMSSGQQTHTVKVPQRSVSKNSLANEPDAVIEYGRTADAPLNNAGYGATGAQNGFAPSYLNNRSTNPNNPFKTQQQQMDDGGGGRSWKPNNLETEQSNLAHGGGGSYEYGSRGQSIPLQSIPHHQSPYD